MSNLGWSIQIVDKGKFEKDLLICIKNHFRDVLIKASPLIKQEMRPLIFEGIEGTLEYQSLCAPFGSLRKHLGLENPKYAMDLIIDEIASDIELTTKVNLTANNQLSGGLYIKWLRSGYPHLLSHTEAWYTSLPSGHDINWLYWLLEKGDSIIITDWHFVNAVANGISAPTSRAGGLMFKGGKWRVPSAFSGTAQNNFLTRAFQVSYIQNKILNMIYRIVGSYL